MKDLFWDRAARKTLTRRMSTVAVQPGAGRVVSVRLFFALAILVSTIGTLVYFSRIREVVCRDDGKSCDQPAEVVSQSLRGRPIFLPISLHFPGKNVQITKTYPATLTVDLTTQETSAYILTGVESPSAIAIRTDGSVVRVPVAQAHSAGALITDLRLGGESDGIDVPSPSQVAYTLLLDFAKTTQVGSVTIRSEDEIALSIGRIQAVMSQAGLEKQLRSLQEILASPTIEEKPARVDMRFAHPIIEYQ